MLSARDARDGREVHAADFDKQIRRDPSVRYNYQEHWQCIGCGDFAWFRRRSRDGRAAVFSSRHFSETWCDFSGRREESEPGEIDESGGPISNSGQVLVLYGTEITENSLTHADGSTRGSRSGRGTNSSGVVRNKQESRLALSRLLTQLEKGTDFSGRTIRLPVSGEQDASDIIRKLEDLTERDISEWRIAWGHVYSAGTTGYGWYLNQGPVGESTATIFVPQKLVEGILAAHRKQALETMGQLADWQVIVFGRVSTTSDQRFRVDLQDPNMIALRPLKYS